MQKYAALRTLATIQKAIAAMIVLFGVLGFLFTLMPVAHFLVGDFGGAVGVLGLVVALIAALPLWCYADLIQVFMDIEENTRNAMQEIRAVHLQQRENTPANPPTTGVSDCPYCGSKSVVPALNEIGINVKKCNDCGRKWR